jgi:GT2 family glycosyltransferase
MNIAVILLTLNRENLTKQVVDQNFYNSGYNADCYLIDNGSDHVPYNLYNWEGCNASFGKRGIAAAVNKGLKMTKTYDGVCLMANDILMPDNWLSNWVTFAKKIPNTGIIGLHCVEELPPLIDGIHKTHTPFGNNFITRELINSIGGYNEEYDPYGMQDRDYAERAVLAGFTNYYIQGKSEHIGHDVGNNSEYRKMKDDSLAKAQKVWEKYQPIYHHEKKLYADFNIDKSK